MRYMPISRHLHFGNGLLLLVIMDIPQYVRDITRLPLFGTRILYVEIYILLVGILVYLRTSRRLPERCRQIVGGWSLQAFIMLAIILMSILAMDVGRGNPGSFFFLQFLLFSICLYYLHLVVSRDGVYRFLYAFNEAVFLGLVFQVLLLCIAWAGNFGNEIAAHRNFYSYLGLMVYLLNRHYQLASLKRRSLIVCLVLIAVNSSKGALLLLLLVPLAELVNKFLVRRHGVTTIILALMVVGIITAPLYMFQLGVYIFDLDVAQILSLEKNRYYINDNITSLLSRLSSVPQTMSQLMASGEIFGLGAEKAGNIKSFGYSVHNYFISAIAIYGAIGLVGGVLLAVWHFNLACTSFVMSLYGLFLLSVSNDLYPFVALIFMPLIWCAPGSQLVRQRRGQAALADLTQKNFAASHDS